MTENKEQLLALVKAADQVAYAMHGFCLKALAYLGEPAQQPSEDAASTTPEAEVPPEAEAPPESEAINKEETRPDPLTVEYVNAKLKAKVQDNKPLSPRIKKLIVAHGGTKVSDVPAEHYAALLDDVEALT